MGDLDIASAKGSDVANAIEDFSVAPQTTDGITGDKETTYVNSDWSKQLGYYKSIPELNTSINIKTAWTIGKGFTADPKTTMILDNVKGIGNETFNTILENQDKVRQIGGDSYAHIITNEKNILINLKPLPPETMRIVSDEFGMIKRYEMIGKIGEEIKVIKKFKTEEIFHLSRNRIADEIHGVSVIDTLEVLILARNEAIADWKRVMHRNVEPLWIFKLNTDNPAKIDAIITKYNAMRKDGENMFVPKGSVEVEAVSVAPNANLNPLAWIEALNSYFYAAVGVPELIVGSGKQFTEASAKIKYLAWEQTVAENQLYLMEKVLADLNLQIQLVFPATLQNEALSEKPKVENRGVEEGDSAMQPNDTTAEMEGNK